MPDPDNMTLEEAARVTDAMLQEKPDMSVFPDAPAAQPVEEIIKPDPLLPIALIRPDHALAVGVAHQKARRSGKTGWEPTPRNNRVYPPNFNGKREIARRAKKMAP